MGYDRKYGKVTTEHGDIPDDEPVVVFRARDINLPDLLIYYHHLCLRASSPTRHVDLIMDDVSQVQAWQESNRDKVKIPDSERSREWMTDAESTGSGVRRSENEERSG